jgi:hypothetical protein
VPGARTVVGMPRRFRGTLPSLVDDRPVLVEHAIVSDKAGGVLIRTSTASAFLLERDDEGPVLVTGVSRLVSPGLFGRLREPVKRGDRRLHRMGVPSDLAINGVLQISSLAEGELAVAVTGLLEHEAVAELAFHRDGGRVPVIRGPAASPIIIEDRRLIAVALG